MNWVCVWCWQINLQLVSQMSDWYRGELHQYACLDRWGTPYSQFGWTGGQTATDILGSGERRVWLNPAVPELHTSWPDSCEGWPRWASMASNSATSWAGRWISILPRVRLRIGPLGRGRWNA